MNRHEADDSPAWQALAAHAEAIRPQHLRDLFADDPERFEPYL
jgi:glucose-6-phosphate isomerase